VHPPEWDTAGYLWRDRGASEERRAALQHRGNSDARAQAEALRVAPLLTDRVRDAKLNGGFARN